MRFIDLELVFRDGSSPIVKVPTIQPSTISRGEDVTYRLRCFNQDGSVRNIAGHTFALGIADLSTGVSVLNRLGSISGAPALGIAIAVINDGDTVAIPTSIYALSIYTNDGTDWQPLPRSPVSIVLSSSVPGSPVTPPGPDMYLVGLPAVAPANVGQVLAVADDSPLALQWVNQSAAAAGVQVMYFDGDPLLTHLNLGLFWRYPFDLGAAFCWDMWAEILSAPGFYVISDGYGGAHALLWDGRSGNIFLDAAGGGGNVSFGTDDEPPPGVLSHFRIGLVDDDQVTTTKILNLFINGVMCGRVAWPAGRTRATQNPASGAGVLFVGGSDHQNANFRLAWMRAWDRVWPFSTRKPESTFVPQKFPMSNGSDAALTPCDLLLNCTAAFGGFVPDQSMGYDGGDVTARRSVHHGRSYTVPPGALVAAGNLVEKPSNYPMPRPERMTGTPLDATGWPASAPSRGLTPAAVPGGARVFDSFSRADQTFAHSAIPTLGSTEGGSRGALAWTQFRLTTVGAANFPSAWGIFNGRAVCLEPNQPSGAVVDNLVADVDVRVTRRKGTFGSGETGIVFRYVDNQNWWSVYYHNRPGSGSDGILFYGYWEAGVWTRVGFTTLAPSVAWDVLRVTVTGNNLAFYTDATSRFTVTNSKFAGATKVGLGTGSDVFPSSQSSLARWDDFTVL